MKRRDFLKVGVGTVAIGTVAISEATGKIATKPVEPIEPVRTVAAESSPYRDWSVKFNTVTARVTRDTYDTFCNNGQQNSNSQNILDYLLSGTDLPHCEKVDGIKQYVGHDNVRVVLTGVVFASNTRQHSENRFAGYEHAGFCLSSPNAQSGVYLAFSEMFKIE